MTYTTNSPAETEALGAALGRVLAPGTVIAYRGDLGAGKTAFTRGLARGLGYAEPVTSPTYTIVNEYLGGRLPLFHFDMYRIGDEDELYSIGFYDYLSKGFCLCEWSENIEGALPENAIRITISKGETDNQRVFEIEGVDIQ